MPLTTEPFWIGSDDGYGTPYCNACGEQHAEEINCWAKCSWCGGDDVTLRHMTEKLHSCIKEDCFSVCNDQECDSRNQLFCNMCGGTELRVLHEGDESNCDCEVACLIVCDSVADCDGIGEKRC